MYTICFILVKPAVPENVGAAARALKTMGFADLRVVKSSAHMRKEAQWLAHGAKDILRGVSVFGSLHEAVADRDFVVGTSARRRTIRVDYHPPRALVEILRGKEASVDRVAMVFGCEESGLSNDELDLCDIVSSIPMKAKYPSLNLGQAVMLYAYELSPLVLRRGSGRKSRKNESSQYALLKERVERLLPDLGFRPDTPKYRRLLERLSLLKGTDVRLAHSVIIKICRKLGREP